LEIKEIDDPAAKELFIALEECFIHDESGIDSLLARIQDESIKAFLVSKGSSPEFRSLGDEPRRLMNDGINEIKKKKLRKRLTEIGAELREIERNENDMGIDELLEEKKNIDLQIKKLEGK
jgi:DNA primase